MMRRKIQRDRCAAVVLALIGVGVGVAVAASQQDPTFKSRVRTVSVWCTVLDEDGRLLPDLGRDDFEIYDNGKRQEMTVFANDIQPITVVVMLDRSGSVAANFSLVEKAAEAFVTHLLPGDKVRIGSFAQRVQVDPRQFTGDRGELLTILRTELQPAGATPLWNAVSVGMTALLHQQGRRVVLVFTDGVDRPMNDRSTNISFKDAMRRAEEEDVMVYAIGLAGDSPMRRRGRMGGGRGGGRRAGDQKPDAGLPKIAAATGGGYFELDSTEDLAATFARVADELHHQYALGFTPEKLDGKMHKLELRVKRSGTTARARKDYLAKP